MKPQKQIYMDYQATTPVDPRVFSSMKPYFTEVFGNPASKSHKFGTDAREAVETARKQVADLIGASYHEIIFTSGATESNNLAIKGVMGASSSQGQHIVTVVTEHPSVLDTCTALEKDGCSVTRLPVKENGLIDLEVLERSINVDTRLVSVMHANNEIGVIQPIKEIGAICQEKSTLFHVDASQSAGKIPIDVREMQIDLLSLTAHKIYGPKGTGALFIHRREPRITLEPQLHGGGHEKGYRSGTLATPLIVGFGEACRLYVDEREQEGNCIKALRDHLYEGIISQIADVKINGDLIQRIPGNLTLSFLGLDADAILANLPEIALSTGSACNSEVIAPSRVITALGGSHEEAYSAIRFGIGRFTTENEINEVIDRIVTVVKRLRDLATE